jgi:hypothetical protein
VPLHSSQINPLSPWYKFRKSSDQIEGVFVSLGKLILVAAFGVSLHIQANAEEPTGATTLFSLNSAVAHIDELAKKTERFEQAYQNQKTEMHLKQLVTARGTLRDAILKADKEFDNETVEAFISKAARTYGADATDEKNWQEQVDQYRGRSKEQALEEKQSVPEGAGKS